MSDKVYLGPLLGYVEPNLRAFDKRCGEIARAAAKSANRAHPMLATFRGPPTANHDPGDEDRR